jgi:predicted RNA-binding Zn-ribbon protein involved in translation (DUF1610 family)
MASWQDDDDELDDTEDPDESDQDSDDESSGTLPCPNCGEDVWEEAERCPHCGENITPRIGSDRKPWWVIAAAILALLAVLLWLAF